MRAVFLSCGGDVFIASLVIKLFKERWYSEVDKFWVCYNNHSGVPKEVAGEFLRNLTQEPKIEIIYHRSGVGNGRPITEMTLISREDLVMLIEDDGFLFESGLVNKYFQMIESDLTDIVGSPRGSCGQEIWERSKELYHLDYSGYGDVGPNFWPNFFFCKRSDLLKTDLNFASKSFAIGEYCRELDYTFKEVNHGDTFVWACMQLKALGLRFHSVPQHHADPYEIENKQKEQMNWHETQKPFGWLHGGSLSASWGGYLSGAVPTAKDDSSLREMETRCALWRIASETTEGFDDFKIEYRKGIDNLIKNAFLDSGNIHKKYLIYKNLMRI